MRCGISMSFYVAEVKRAILGSVEQSARQLVLEARNPMPNPFQYVFMRLFICYGTLNPKNVEMVLQEHHFSLSSCDVIYSINKPAVTVGSGLIKLIMIWSSVIKIGMNKFWAITFQRIYTPYSSRFIVFWIHIKFHWWRFIGKNEI